MRSLLFYSFVLFVTSFSMAQVPPLVDGDCSEYDKLRSTSFVLSPDVKLRVYQDKHFVWFCYQYPEGSFGTMDLKLRTSKFPDGINLHVSASLGEWPLDKPDLAPKTPDSDLWWNNVGWIANPIWTNGMDTSGERPRFKFKNSKARELQISKERFGKGKWTWSIQIRAIKGGDGKNYTIDHPKTGESSLEVK